MSVVGVVLVYRCDGCDAHKIVHTEADLLDFGETWFVGMTHDFCPACRHKVEHQAAIAEEEADWFDSSARIVGAVTKEVSGRTNTNGH